MQQSTLSTVIRSLISNQLEQKQKGNLIQLLTVVGCQNRLRLFCLSFFLSFFFSFFLSFFLFFLSFCLPVFLSFFFFLPSFFPQAIISWQSPTCRRQQAELRTRRLGQRLPVWHPQLQHFLWRPRRQTGSVRLGLPESVAMQPGQEE